MTLTTQPTRSLLLLLGTVFIAVVIVLVISAWWYKKTTGNTYVPAQEETNSVSESATPMDEKVLLKLIPTSLVDNTETYRIVIDGMTEPVNGIVFQITDSAMGTQLLSSLFTTNSTLSEQGWKVLIDTRTKSETGQVLTYSIVRVMTDSSDVLNTLELGTLKFSVGKNTVEQELRLVEEESIVTYSSGKFAPLKLVIETANTDN